MKASAVAVLCMGLLCVGTQAANGQTAASAPRPAPAPGSIAAHPDWPKADPADVKTPEAIIAALSSSISGEAGQARNWDRFRSLFVPGAGRLVVTRVPKTGPSDVTVLSMEDYITRSTSGAPQSFYEIPMAYDVQNFGRMSHVYESYGLHHIKDDQPFTRGVNSFELLSDGSRFYILQVFWDTERPDNPLPAKLQK